MKKADADSCASASLNVKIPFTAATSGSISEVMKPQAKNSTVTAAKAAMAFDRPPGLAVAWLGRRSEEHTSELQSLMRKSYAVFCLKQKKQHKLYIQHHNRDI